MRNDKEIEIHFALVDKRLRGMGLGSLCVSLMLSLCFQRAKKVFVGAEKITEFNNETGKIEFVDKNKSPVVRFWRREGFQEITESVCWGGEDYGVQQGNWKGRIRGQEQISCCEILASGRFSRNNRKCLLGRRRLRSSTRKLER